MLPSVAGTDVNYTETKSPFTSVLSSKYAVQNKLEIKILPCDSFNILNVGLNHKLTIPIFKFIYFAGFGGLNFEHIAYGLVWAML